jgi:hypothetical protein
MRKLTTRLIDCSRKAGMDGVEHGVAISGEPPWKGVPKFARLVRPLLDSFYQNDQQTLALLVDYLWVPRVASSDELKLDTGGVCEVVAKNMEG